MKFENREIVLSPGRSMPPGGETAALRGDGCALGLEQAGGGSMFAAVLSLLSFFLFAQSAWAVVSPPISPRCFDSANPNIPSLAVAVDGDISEWNTSTSGDDFFVAMHQAWRLDKDVLSNVFMRYDVATGKMYVLVYRANDSWPIMVQDGEEVYIKIGPKVLTPESPDFAWVDEDAGTGTALGYEGSFSIAQGYYSNITFHVNVDKDGSEETSGSRDESLEINCADPGLTAQCVSDEIIGNSEVGDRYTYTFPVTNTGAGSAENVEIVVQLNQNFLFVANADHNSVSNPDGPSDPSCTVTDTDNLYGAQEVTCTLVGDLASNGVWTPSVEVEVDQIAGGPPIQVTVMSDNDSYLGNNDDSCTGSTPVTLSSFEATGKNGKVTFRWTTATETMNVGYDLYVENAFGRERLNDVLIPSEVGDSDEPQYYSFKATEVVGDTFYLVDLSGLGTETTHGPFKLGESHGSEPVVERTDWKKIRAEHKRLKKQRADKLDKQRSQSKKHGGKPKKPAAASLRLVVTEDGIHRVSLAALEEHGLTGFAVSDLVLHNAGVPVPLHAVEGEGGYIEFVGREVGSLYTDQNPYVLEIAEKGGARVRLSNRSLPDNFQPAEFYMETITVDQLPNLKPRYSQTAPGGDPWYADRLLAYGSPLTRDYDGLLEVDGYVSGVASVTLQVKLWGGTSFAAAPDHHVRVAVNGNPVAESLFDGITVQSLGGTLPEGVLRDGGNQISIQLPNEFDPDEVWFDLVNLDRISLSFPRRFDARSGALSFRAAGKGFTVAGLPDADIVVFRVDDKGRVEMLTPVVASVDGGYTASFVGSRRSATYYVASSSALFSPAIEPTTAAVDCGQGEEARYLVVAHDDFINADLDKLIERRTTQGYSADVVSVAGLYARYSHGIVDPEAIRACIADAVQERGTEAVLLVGGESYDPMDRLGYGAMSFVPTIYAKTDAIVTFAPVDSSFADVDRDKVPDVAIGRFPVRTENELASLVSNTLAYGTSGSGRRAVFAADLGFDIDSNAILRTLPAGWDQTRAYISDDGVDGARTKLIGAINGNPGVALTAYVGHSSWSLWSFNRLFTAGDAAALTNDGSPTVVTQWGCWNTYYVSPKGDSMGHKFLLSGDRGAAAVMGASALTKARNEKELGRRLFAEGGLADGYTTIGAAILQAKQSLAVDHPEWFDVILGYSLLGDPLLIVDDVAH